MDTLALKFPEWSKSWVTEQLAELTMTLEDSPSLNWKVHLNRGVPPVKVAVNVDCCPTRRLLLDAVKLVRDRAGTEKV